jgi:hypothetical protein
MDLDGKMSQGIPIGNDLSFLLSEVVLAQVDRSLKVSGFRAYRWYDDYEIAFDTNDQAEDALKRLSKELNKFRLRLNPRKTAVVRLPRPAEEEWQELLKHAGSSRFRVPREMVAYFDTAFRLREKFPEVPVLLYALAILFNLRFRAPPLMWHE